MQSVRSRTYLRTLTCKTIEFRKVVGNGVETTFLFGKILRVFRTTLIAILIAIRFSDIP